MDRYCVTIRTSPDISLAQNLIRSRTFRIVPKGVRAALLGLLIFGSICPAADAEPASDGISRRETSIVVRKAERLLELFRNGGRIRTYRISLGSNPVGTKTSVGDKKTPEGDYYVCYKSSGSRFWRFLGLSYPGEEDARRAFESGAISVDKRNLIVDSIRDGKRPPWDTELGGWVGIHGYPTDEYLRRWCAILLPKPDNWTDGCIAMWNSEIEELFSLVNVGTPVLIVP